jgi:hypothetical protein
LAATASLAEGANEVFYVSSALSGHGGSANGEAPGPATVALLGLGLFGPGWLHCISQVGKKISRLSLIQPAACGFFRRADSKEPAHPAAALASLGIRLQPVYPVKPMARAP